MEKKLNVLFVMTVKCSQFSESRTLSGEPKKSHFKEEMHFDAAGLMYDRLGQKCLNIHIW